MSDLAIRQVLSQIRSLQTQMTPPAAPAAAPAGGAEGNFADLLKQGVEQVSRLQKTTSSLQESFARGDRSVELADVMLASAKSQVGFRAATEVRNRLVSAYQDIMNLPL
jgi:flagellar hook-basal body complex protein FliE